MTARSDGIKVSLFLDEGEHVEGLAAGAESPNDFWSKFKTQFVRIDGARHFNRSGQVSEHASLYVNRDRIRLAKVLGS